MSNEDEYVEELDEKIRLSELSFSPFKYQAEEIRFLNPQLEELGYKDITWETGDGDSFGPLTRVARMTAPDGKKVWWMYG
jgi:hypothetical protein